MATRSSRSGRPDQDDVHSSPILWFALLERARLTADSQLAKQARTMLARAGVYVIYNQDSSSLFTLTESDLKQLAAQLAELLRSQAAPAAARSETGDVNAVPSAPFSPGAST